MKTSENEKTENGHKNDHSLLILCFLASALIGYFLTHLIALVGA